MKLITMELGPLATDSYILKDETTCDSVIIDAADNADEILRLLSENSCNLKYIVQTHGHCDHIKAVNTLRTVTGASLCIHREDIELLTDPIKNLSSAIFRRELTVELPPEVILSDGTEIVCGPIKLKTLHTPGHTKGSCTFICDNRMFSGDTLFDCGIGRTDFYGGSISVMKESLKRLCSLPQNYEVFPGHGPATRLDIQRICNPYLKGLSSK